MEGYGGVSLLKGLKFGNYALTDPKYISSPAYDAVIYQAPEGLIGVVLTQSGTKSRMSSQEPAKLNTYYVLSIASMKSEQDLEYLMQVDPNLSMPRIKTFKYMIGGYNETTAYSIKEKLLRQHSDTEKVPQTGPELVELIVQYLTMNIKRSLINQDKTTA